MLDDWEQEFDKRFTVSTDNGKGPEFLFRDNGDGTISIALKDDVKAFIRSIIKDPGRKWLERMGDAEDSAGCVSVGGMAADLGMPMTDVTDPAWREYRTAQRHVVESRDDECKNYWRTYASGILCAIDAIRRGKGSEE